MLSDISHNLIKELFNCDKIRKIQLTNSSYTWLDELFKKIKNITRHPLTTNEIVQCSTLNLEKEYNNRFVAPNIKDDIKTFSNCHQFEILNTTIVIGDKYLDKINLKHIARIISIMRFLSGHTNHIRINIWNTPHTKLLSHKCSKLEPVNINSGSTLPGQFINLWRHEELYKVLIHELVHTFFLDFRDDGTIEPYIRKNFGINIDSPVYIWESYTEFLAIIIHSIYVSKKLDDVIKMLSVEKYFGYFQCAKILNHFGCESRDDLVTKQCELSYDTDVLSYFYIKTALLHSFNESIQFMNENNINLVKFNESSISEYLQLIKNSTNNTDFIETINSYFNKLDNNKSLQKTLRMSIIELQ